MDIDPGEIGKLIAETSSVGVPSRGLHVEFLSATLLDTVLRLLNSPRDITMLAPLVQQEILYRRLCSPRARCCTISPTPTARPTG